MASRKTTSEGLLAARFSITIDGVEIAAFSELLDLTSSIEPDEIEPDTAPTAKKLPGKRNPPTVTLKRGMTKNVELWAWHEAAWVGDASARKNCSLVMFSAEGKPVARFHLENAWPSRVSIAAPKAGGNEAMKETVTLVCDDLQRLTPA